MRVEFLVDYDYSPTRRVTIAYKANRTYNVKIECAEAALAAGKARKPRRAAVESPAE